MSGPWPVPPTRPSSVDLAAICLFLTAPLALYVDVYMGVKEYDLFVDNPDQPGIGPWVIWLFGVLPLTLLLGIGVREGNRAARWATWAAAIVVGVGVLALMIASGGEALGGLVLVLALSLSSLLLGDEAGSWFDQPGPRRW